MDPSAESVSVTSVFGPLVAVLLAVLTRRVHLALFGGALVGAILHLGPLAGAIRVGQHHLIQSAIGGSHPYIIAFTLLVLASVRLNIQSGAVAALLRRVQGRIASSRAVKSSTALMGLVVFFDDYANSMLVGPAMRPLSDRFRISREKLAYLVDSTAAPVAGLAVVSTWVGYEVGLLSEVGAVAGWTGRGYEVLLSALPYRFYCVFALCVVFATSWMERDFGPMLVAERRARTEEPRDTSGDTAEVLASGRGKARHALIPIALLLAVTVLGLALDGGSSELQKSPAALLSWSFWRHSILKSENSPQVLCVAALVMAGVSVGFAIFGGALSVRQTRVSFIEGLKSALSPISILILAWALASVCREAGTGPFLAQALNGQVALVLIPLVTFLVAAVTAFATGTSWATMAIVLPVAVPWAYGAGNETLALIAAASVMDGAIFGDHCSPISDTTVISSVSTSCELVSHVRTQLPYATLAMVTAGLVGYLPVSGLGLSPLWSYGIGALLVVGLVRLMGKKSA